MTDISLFVGEFYIQLWFLEQVLGFVKVLHSYLLTNCSLNFVQFCTVRLVLVSCIAKTVVFKTCIISITAAIFSALMTSSTVLHLQVTILMFVCYSQFSKLSVPECVTCRRKLSTTFG